MVVWAPIALRWITGFWCLSTLFFSAMMIIKPQIPLSVFHSNVNDYKKFFGNKHVNQDEANNGLSNIKTNDGIKHNERHLQRLIGIQAVGRALYGIFVIISGDNNALITFCIVNIITDSMSGVLYWSSRDLIMRFQVYTHLVIFAILNLLQLIFVCLSASNYRLKSD
eukprot:UN04924